MRNKSLTVFRAFKWFAAALGLVALATVSYGVWSVFSARQYTTSEVLPHFRAAHYSLRLADLNHRQLDILLKVEDPNFFHHSGVDLSTPGAGLTTITQSLVKKLYFDKFEPGLAKIRQTLIARFALDPLMAKDEQLTLFINSIYLGNGAYGFLQASQIYFHKPFASLTEDQYIALVAMIIAPKAFDLKKFPARNNERVSRIKRLVSGEYKPRGLFDMYYGKIDPEAQINLPPVSYFPSYYD